MNAPLTKKPENKSNAKPDMTKTITDQKKVISQLKQEIKNLTNSIKDMQHKPDTQSFIITISQRVFIKLNAHLAEFAHDTGNTMSLSEFISEAIEYCIYCEEENNRTEAEEKKAELEKPQE
jgi:hypothetical protein